MYLFFAHITSVVKCFVKNTKARFPRLVIVNGLTTICAYHLSNVIFWSIDDVLAQKLTTEIENRKILKPKINNSIKGTNGKI